MVFGIGGDLRSVVLLQESAWAILIIALAATAESLGLGRNRARLRTFTAQPAHTTILLVDRCIP